MTWVRSGCATGLAASVDGGCSAAGHARKRLLRRADRGKKKRPQRAGAMNTKKAQEASVSGRRSWTRNTVRRSSR